MAHNYIDSFHVGMAVFDLRNNKGYIISSVDRSTWIITTDMMLWGKLKMVDFMRSGHIFYYYPIGCDYIPPVLTQLEKLIYNLSDIIV